MTATRIQSFGVQPAMLTFPSPTTTIGASARIGIVCDATTYGMTPRCSTPKRAISAPSRKPHRRTDDESDRRFLGGEERRVEHVPREERLALANRVEQRPHDVVEVRHGRRVHGERPRPARRLPQLPIPLPQRPQPAGRTSRRVSARAPQSSVSRPASRRASHTRSGRLESCRGARSEANRHRAEGAARAHRRRERRAARRLDGDLGARSRWLRGLVAGTGAEETIDAAGNQWFTLAGASDRRCSSAVTSTRCRTAAGSTAASTSSPAPRCSGASPTREPRRSRSGSSTGPTRRARFGRSLFGSSAAAGSMADQDELRQLADRDGVALPDALAAYGVDLDSRARRHSELDSPPPTSSSTSSKGPSSNPRSAPRRRARHLRRRAAPDHLARPGAHAGSTPMDKRRDALAGAAKLALEIRDIAARTGDGAVCTSGGVVCKPGIVTSVVETAEQLLDQRHLDAAKLAAMLADAKAASERFAAEESIDVEWERIWSIEPILFDDTLDRLLRRGDPRGRRRRAPPPVRSAARRRRGLPRRGSDRDALRPEPAWPVAHEARGHEGGAPRARRRGARPARLEDDRLGRSRRRALSLTASERGVVAGLAVGGCLTWNISNVGAVADPLSDHYGVSLAAVGLLTTALFVTHLAVQLPAGRGADRYGSQRIALVAIAAAVMGNGILLLDEGFELALLGRAVVGIGSGAAFVAGLDLVRAGGGGSRTAGLYGGATMAGGGLALMVVPRSPTRRAGARPTGAPRCSRSSLPSRPSWPPASPASATPGTGCSEIAPPADRHPAGGDVRTRRDRGKLGRTAPRAPGRVVHRGRARRRARPLHRHPHAPAGRPARRSRRAACSSAPRSPERPSAPLCSPSAAPSPSPRSGRSCWDSPRGSRSP